MYNIVYPLFLTIQAHQYTQENNVIQVKLKIWKHSKLKYLKQEKNWRKPLL